MKPNSRTIFALACCFTATVVVAESALAKAPTQKPSLPLEGKLVQLPSGPALRVHGKDYPLSATRSWYFNTLKDERLANRQIRVEGEWAPDGTLKVSHFYTVKNGKLYRVRYYCDVCNLEALEPGKCDCCQAPTELQEIPLP